MLLFLFLQITLQKATVHGLDTCPGVRPNVIDTCLSITNHNLEMDTPYTIRVSAGTACTCYLELHGGAILDIPSDPPSYGLSCFLMPFYKDDQKSQYFKITGDVACANYMDHCPIENILRLAVSEEDDSSGQLPTAIITCGLIFHDPVGKVDMYSDDNFHQGPFELMPYVGEIHMRCVCTIKVPVDTKVTIHTNKECFWNETILTGQSEIQISPLDGYNCKRRNYFTVENREKVKVGISCQPEKTLLSSSSSSSPSSVSLLKEPVVLGVIIGLAVLTFLIGLLIGCFYARCTSKNNEELKVSTKNESPEKVTATTQQGPHLPQRTNTNTSANYTYIDLEQLENVPPSAKNKSATSTIIANPSANGPQTSNNESHRLNNNQPVNMDANNTPVNANQTQTGDIPKPRMIPATPGGDGPSDRHGYFEVEDVDPTRVAPDYVKSQSRLPDTLVDNPGYQPFKGDGNSFVDGTNEEPSSGSLKSPQSRLPDALVDNPGYQPFKGDGNSFVDGINEDPSSGSRKSPQSRLPDALVDNPGYQRFKGDGDSFVDGANEEQQLRESQDKD